MSAGALQKLQELEHVLLRAEGPVAQLTLAQALEVLRLKVGLHNRWCWEDDHSRTCNCARPVAEAALAAVEHELGADQVERAHERDRHALEIRTVCHVVGGLVEGAPPHAGNYLQRLRQLVAAEQERDQHLVRAQRAEAEVEALRSSRDRDLVGWQELRAEEARLRALVCEGCRKGIPLDATARHHTPLPAGAQGHLLCHAAPPPPPFYVCTADAPWKPEMGPRAQHPAAEIVGECLPGCCDRYRCPHCGHAWTAETPQ